MAPVYLGLPTWCRSWTGGLVGLNMVGFSATGLSDRSREGMNQLSLVWSCDVVEHATPLELIGDGLQHRYNYIEACAAHGQALGDHPVFVMHFEIYVTLSTLSDVK